MTKKAQELIKDMRSRVVDAARPDMLPEESARIMREVLPKMLDAMADMAGVTERQMEKAMKDDAKPAGETVDANPTQHQEDHPTPIVQHMQPAPGELRPGQGDPKATEIKNEEGRVDQRAMHDVNNPVSPNRAHGTNPDDFDRRPHKPTLEDEANAKRKR